jgi:membrane-bound serine protease (ClpP class)
MSNWSAPVLFLFALISTLAGFPGVQPLVAVAEQSVADTVAADSTSKPLVHLLKIQTVNTEGGMIDPGITAFVERAVQDANEADADAIVFEIDTFGGRVDAATVISDAIIDADPLTIAFINKRAISAGALISLACDKIVMVKGGEIGAVTPVTGGGDKADDKIVSAMRAQMRANAEAKLGDAEIVEVDINWAEQVVRLLTHPVVTSILLSVAVFGLIAEVRTPGWGLGGSMALIALALFFGSHLVIHLAEWDELLLFVVGLVLLIVEIAIIPGFGFVGVAGVLCMVASLLLTRLPAYDFWGIDEISAVVGQLALSMIIGIVGSAIVLRSLPKFALFNRLILSSDTPASDGYVSAPTEHDRELVGMEGVTLTELRPVGIGMFDGRRVDIIAEGEFIQNKTTVKVIEARGSRVVVRPL